MPYEQVQNILDLARSFHRKLADFYQELDEATEEEKERMKLVLQYLQDHERTLDRKLSQFQTDAPKNILDTWVQFPPENRIDRIFDPKQIKSDMSVNDIVALTLDFDNALLQFYKKAQDVAATDAISEIFEDLYKEGKTERQNLVQSIFGF